MLEVRDVAKKGAPSKDLWSRLVGIGLGEVAIRLTQILLVKPKDRLARAINKKGGAILNDQIAAPRSERREHRFDRV